MTLSRCMNTSWGSKEDVGSLSSDVPGNRTGGNEHKLKDRNIHLREKILFFLCGILGNGTGFSEWL